jgi:hypothetical protein
VAGFTDHYGWAYLGAGDSLSFQNYKFTNADRHDLDEKVWLGAEGHRHLGTITLEGPATAPVLTASTTGGTLPGSSRIYYRWSWVDPDNVEAPASPSTFVDTAAAISPPGLGTISTSPTGGVLEPGNYYYVFTAYQGASTVETTAGSYHYIAVPAGTSTNTITITLPSLPTGATGLNVYRKKPNQTHYYHLDTLVFGATPPTTFTDDGNIDDDCDRTLPTSNTTNASNSVVVDISTASPAIPAGYTWKVYRSYDNAEWTATLIAHVTTLVGATPTAVQTYTDTGVAATGSSPRLSNEQNNPSKVILTDSLEVQGVLPPANHVQSHPVEFVMPGPVVEVTGTVVWRCPFDHAYIKEVGLNLGRDSVPAFQPVTVDVNKYDGVAETWGSVFTVSALPTVPVGESFGTFVEPDVRYLVKGDALSVDVTQAGGGATPTDSDLFVSVTLWVWQSEEITTPIFP